MKQLFTFTFLLIAIDLLAFRGKSGELINPISIADEIADSTIQGDSCRFYLNVIDNYNPSEKDSLMVSVFFKDNSLFPNFNFFNIATDSNGLAQITHLPGKYFVKITKNCSPDFKLDFELTIDTLKHSRTATANISQIGPNRLILVSKPVIYCYPEKNMDVNISLKTETELTFTYPVLNESWCTTLFPNGDIEVDGKKYPYLFWEGSISENDLPNNQKGFIVSNSDAISFFEEKLGFIGLNQKETTDFITFWAPKMTAPSYQVEFLIGDEYNEHIGELEYSISPDSEIRIFAIITEHDGTSIKEQILKPIKRNGFTVVEWGGSIVTPNPLNL